MTMLPPRHELDLPERGDMYVDLSDGQIWVFDKMRWWKAEEYFAKFA